MGLSYNCMKLNLITRKVVLAFPFLWLSCNNQRITPTDYNNKMVGILSSPINDMHDFWNEVISYVKNKDSLKTKVHLEQDYESLRKEIEVSIHSLKRLGDYKTENDFYDYSLSYLNSMDSLIKNDFNVMLEVLEPNMEHEGLKLYSSTFMEFRRIERELKHELDSVQLKFIKEHNIQIK